jgi:hypothetical protein
MSDAYRIAHEATTKSAEKGRKELRSSYTLHGLTTIGDRVLVRNISPRGGPGKLLAF